MFWRWVALGCRGGGRVVLLPAVRQWRRGWGWCSCLGGHPRGQEGLHRPQVPTATATAAAAAAAAEPAAAAASSAEATGEGSAAATAAEEGVGGAGERAGTSEQPRRGAGRPWGRGEGGRAQGGGGGLRQGGRHSAPLEPQAARHRGGGRWRRPKHQGKVSELRFVASRVWERLFDDSKVSCSVRFL